MSAASKPTIGQLERSLSQKIQALYREQLGHLPSKVTCQIFGEKLAVVIENSITQPEKLLVEEGQKDLATQVRHDLDDAIQPQLKDLIEAVLGVKALDILSDATLSTERTGLIVILDGTPDVRNPGSIPKTKSKAN